MAFHSLGSCLVVALVLLSLLFVLLMITSHDKRLAFCSKLIQSQRRGGWVEEGLQRADGSFDDVT